MSIKNSSRNDRVAQALGIYRSIAACNERLARGNDIHALTAALMLPCYQAEFRRLAGALSAAEQDELSAVLRRMECAEAPRSQRRLGGCVPPGAADGTGRALAAAGSRQPYST